MRFYELDKKAQENALEKCRKVWGNVTPREIDEDYMLWFDEDGEPLGEYRICSICGSEMVEGFCFNSGDRYYCSDECLHHDFTTQEWYAECEENEDSYWTQWY